MNEVRRVTFCFSVSVILAWLLTCLASDVEKPASLRLKGEDLPFRYENRTLTFEVPWHLKSNLTDVVELKFR